MTHSFVLHSLGGPALFAVAGEQVRFRTRKHFALLVRLALEPGKQFTRDYLADLLWPEAPARHANHSLAQGLSVIKAKIAREAVVIQRATVGLAAGWIDVDVTHLTTGDVSIDGPFLDGFEIPDARPFEDWKGEFRARLIPQVRDCLVRQMDGARRIGDFPTVERHATRLQDLDPLAEGGIRGIMEARAWASDRSGALKAFARYEAQLADELGAKPGPELVRMADLLRDGRGAPSRPVTPGYPPERADRRFEPETLIGREREFSVLYDAWLEARRKSPRIVVVTSDPGVGKTTLVNAFASSCQMEGAVVARAQAYDGERELPFAVLGELVKQLATQRAIGSADPEALSELTRISSEILKAFPGVPKPVEWSPELMPLRIADAFLKTVTAAAADSPVMLVVDDVHAADNASTAILHSVARKLTDTRVLLVLAGRPSELRLSGAPWALTTDPSIERMQALDLEVLSHDSAEELSRRIASSLQKSEPPIGRILRAGGGNPLAIELLTREWGEHGAASLLRDLEALDTQPVATIGIPRAIGVVFERQTRRLEPLIRATLDLAAVLGRRLTEVDLFAAIDLSPGQAAEALSRLKDEGYLRDVSGELEFRNELIRAQAYYSVAGATRQHLHRRVAALLIQSHSNGDKAVCLEIAWHQIRGGDVTRAMPFAIEGSEAVLGVGAPHEAEEILNAIVDFKQEPEQFKRVRLLLAKALVDQSKNEAAVPLIEGFEADTELSIREQAEVAMLRAMAEFGLNRERNTKYYEVAKIALDAATHTGDRNLISRALFECARAGMEEGVAELVEEAEKGIDQLLERADEQPPAMAILTKAFCRFFFWDHKNAVSDLQRVLHSDSTRINKAELCFIYSGFGIAKYFLGRFSEARDAFVSALGLAIRVGDDFRLAQVASNLCALEMTRGNFIESIKYGEMSISAGEACSSGGLLPCYTNLMDSYLLVGREQDAAQCLEKARKWLTPERRWKLHCVFLIEAASFAFSQHNQALSLDLISQLEFLCRGRQQAVPMPGPYWKMIICRESLIGDSRHAHDLASRVFDQFYTVCPFHCLDVSAVMAWLERRIDGRITEKTKRGLALFDSFGAYGKRALLTLQGFLPPRQQAEPLNKATSITSADEATPDREELSI
ncbi:MAG TPA: AAA family ATPase [Terriglobales bacterium]|nr:AAA family ATPase [Terriglobales bacterium]